MALVWPGAGMRNRDKMVKSQPRWIVALAALLVVMLLVWAAMRWISNSASNEPLMETAVPGATVTPQLPALPTATPGPQPQPGGTVVELVARSADTFNPLLTTNRTSQAVAAKLYPVLVGQDPQTGTIVPTGLATEWTVSPDGRTYTFTLTDQSVWSDGVPVTAADFAFTYRAVADAGVQSPYRTVTANIMAITTPDAHTVVVTLAEPDCDLPYALTLPWLPSHRYAPDFSDIRTNPLNLAPSVSAGPLLFAGTEADGSVRLTRNPDFWAGPVWMDGWSYRVESDPAQRLTLLATGEADLALLPASAVIADPPGPGLVAYEFADDGYSFVAVNLADPGEPVPGVDANGDPVHQPPHPVLGQGAVRQALARSLDVDRLIREVYAGYGERLTSFVLPTLAFAYAQDLPPVAYDPAAAGALLDGAGWTLNGATIRQKEGKLLRLSLLVNDDDPVRVALGAAIQSQWQAVGFDIALEKADFAQVTGALFDQTYDLVLTGWADLGAVPTDERFWRGEEDLPGAGLNFTSYVNPEVAAALSAARHLPGCDPTQRAQRYTQAQTQIQTDAPYLFLSVQKTTLVYADRWLGIDPGPWGYAGNLADWFLTLK